MQHSFTKEFMENNCGCYSKEKLYKCSFMNNKSSVTLDSIISSEIPLKDKFWFVCKKLATREENQQIAINVAETLLPIFEKEYPNDDRPRKAIEAAKAYITGHISLEKLIEYRRAAAAAANTAAADADVNVAASAANAANASANAAAGAAAYLVANVATAAVYIAPAAVYIAAVDYLAGTTAAAVSVAVTADVYSLYADIRNRLLNILKGYIYENA